MVEMPLFSLGPLPSLGSTWSLGEYNVLLLHGLLSGKLQHLNYPCDHQGKKSSKWGGATDAQNPVTHTLTEASTTLKSTGQGQLCDTVGESKVSILT